MIQSLIKNQNIIKSVKDLTINYQKNIKEKIYYHLMKVSQFWNKINQLAKAKELKHRNQLSNLWHLQKVVIQVTIILLFQIDLRILQMVNFNCHGDKIRITEAKTYTHSLKANNLGKAKLI